ncbi:hypothetical protein D3C85_796140 [compost metagenome]
MQDARAGPSTGFRPPFGLGRVTFLCVAKEKSPKERPPPPIRWLRQCPRIRANVGGPPQTAHPCAHCGYAIIPDGVPDVASDPRRIGGGINTVPDFDLGESCMTALVRMRWRDLGRQRHQARPTGAPSEIRRRHSAQLRRDRSAEPGADPVRRRRRQVVGDGVCQIGSALILPYV